MLTISIIVLASAAVGGSVLAFMFLREKEVPSLFAIGHGIAGASGLVLLLFALGSGLNNKMVLVTLAFFALAVIEGFVMFVSDIQSRLLIFIHGLTVAAAFVLLVLYLMS